MTGPYSVRPRWGRREFLKSSVAGAAVTYGVSPSFAMAAPVPEEFDGSAFELKAPQPNAKAGGVLRHGMPLRAIFTRPVPFSFLGPQLACSTI